MNQFIELLEQATKKIDSLFIQLPVARKETPIYRERVYCYELYHQLRVVWPESYQYFLCGEIDKNGHPIIRGNELDKTKPDLLVHVPGYMDRNLVVIEVKSINAHLNGIKKDLETLTAYREKAKYKNAIFLIYGEEKKKKIERIIKSSKKLESSSSDGKIDLTKIRLFYHEKSGSSAKEKQWNL